MARNDLSRRRFLQLTGLSGASAFLAACTGSSATSAPATAAPTNAPTAASASATTIVPTSGPTAAPSAGVGSGLRGKIRVLNSLNLDPLQTATDATPHVPTALSELAKQYMAMNPGAEIEFVKWPGSEYWSTTLNTWLAGGTAPDVFPLFYSLVPGIYQNGTLVNLEPYLAKPNAYAAAGQPGNVKWADQFVSNYAGTAAPDGNHYTAIFDANWVASFYNVDIFNKLGVKPPSTWAELVALLKTLKGAGYTPYSTLGPWIMWFIQTMLWSEKAKEIRLTPATGFKNISAEEMARAYKKGIFTPKDPLWKEPHRILQELAQYTTPGIGSYAKDYYLGPDFNRLFLTEKSPIHYDLASFTDVVRADKTRQWNINHFWVPEITRESSQYATGARVGSVIFEGDAMWAVPTFSKNVDLAVDWLRFISLPANISKVVQDGNGGTFTMVNGYDDPEFPVFKEQLDLGFYYITANGYGATIVNGYNNQLLPQLLDQQISVDDFATQFDQIIAANIDKLITDSKWDTTKW